MRTIFAHLTAAALVTQAMLIGGRPAPAVSGPEAVEIAQKEGGRLKALLFRPDGQGPFPAVVALHNCTGLNNRAGTLGARYRDWGERLAKAGFVAIFPDSNASRGAGSQCGTR